MTVDRRRTTRRAVVVLLALVLLASCSNGSDSLRAWADGKFDGSDGRYTTTAAPASVESQFTSFRRPIDRFSKEGRTFLQYRDDIVAIIPAGGRTTVEIDGSRTGRRRHFLFIGNRWGRYQSYTDSSRGGGSGSGK